MGFRDVMLDKGTQRANAMRRKKVGDFLGEKLREIKRAQKKQAQRTTARRGKGREFLGRVKKVQVRRFGMVARFQIALDVRIKKGIKKGTSYMGKKLMREARRLAAGYGLKRFKVSGKVVYRYF